MKTAASAAVRDGGGGGAHRRGGGGEETAAPAPPALACSEPQGQVSVAIEVGLFCYRSRSLLL